MCNLLTRKKNNDIFLKLEANNNIFEDLHQTIGTSNLFTN